MEENYIGGVLKPMLDGNEVCFLSDFIRQFRGSTGVWSGGEVAQILSAVRSVQHTLHDLPVLRLDVAALERKLAESPIPTSSLENAADIEALQNTIRSLSERIDNLNPNFGAF